MTFLLQISLGSENCGTSDLQEFGGKMSKLKIKETETFCKYKSTLSVYGE